MGKNAQSSGAALATVEIKKPLSAEESRELEGLEAEIAETLPLLGLAFDKIGRALQTIRDKRLYRGGYPTFDLYCHALWKFGASRARQLIGAVGTVEKIQTVTGVTQSPWLESERCVRELVSIAGTPEILVPTIKRIQARVEAGELITSDVVAKEKEAVIAQIVGPEEADKNPSSTTMPDVWGSSRGDQEPKKRTKRPKRTPEARATANRDDRIDILMFEASKLSREVEDLALSPTPTFARKYIKPEHMFKASSVTKAIKLLTAIDAELRAKTSPPASSKGTAKAIAPRSRRSRPT